MPFINNGGGGGATPKSLDISSGTAGYPGTGLINSSNTNFTLPTGYAPGSLSSDWDGILQAPGFVAITETSPGAGTFSFSSAPPTGTKVVMHYGAA